MKIIHYREATSDDIEDIFSLVYKTMSEYVITHESSEEKEALKADCHSKISENIKTGNEFFIVAEDSDNKIIGVSGLLTESNVLNTLYVNKNHHRKGIGKRLLKMLLSDYKDITVYSSVYAIDFYKAVGFIAEGDIRNKNGIRFLKMQLSSPTSLNSPHS